MELDCDDDGPSAAPVSCTAPAAQVAAPLVLDSPHSGRDYPADFAAVLERQRLRALEDGFVDRLLAHAPALGATLVHARFPRSYIDPNRAIDDIYPASLADGWSGVARPTRKALLGVGLVFMRSPAGESIYASPPSSADVGARIARCYEPYHAVLRDELVRAHQRFGFVWHLNCHSMPSSVGGGSGSAPARTRPDFCIGNRHGRSCAPDLTRLVVRHLRGLGYTTTVNDPYAGVELVRRYGDPARGFHSLQIEISRALYMDERAHRLHDGFERLREVLDSLIATLAARAHTWSGDAFGDAAE